MNIVLRTLTCTDKNKIGKPHLENSRPSSIRQLNLLNLLNLQFSTNFSRANKAVCRTARSTNAASTEEAERPGVLDRPPEPVDLHP